MDHMARERVAIGGRVRPLEPYEELPCSRIPADTIGTIKSDMVQRLYAAHIFEL